MANVNPMQVEKFLKGIDFPISKMELIKQVEQNGADEQVRSMLAQLPEQKYNSVNDITKALGSINRGPRR